LLKGDLSRKINLEAINFYFYDGKKKAFGDYDDVKMLEIEKIQNRLNKISGRSK
jgi:hypothetical protein